MSDYKWSMYNIVVSKDKEKSYVYNTASGVGAYVDNATVRKCKAGKAIDSEDESVLKKCRFLVYKEIDEYGVQLRKRDQDLYNNFRGMLFVITPTMNCNADCKYCFERGLRCNSRMSEEMQEKTIKYIKDTVSRHFDVVKVVSLSFFGGEPTLEIDIVKKISTEILKFCKKNNVKYNARIITNGILLNKKNCKILSKAGVTHCQVTIDGLAKSWSKQKRLPEKLYDTVINNLHNAVDNGIKPNIRVNIDNSNKNDMFALMDMLFDKHGLAGKVHIYPAQIREWNDAGENEYISDKDFAKMLEKYRYYALSADWQKSFDTINVQIKKTSCGFMRDSSIGIRYDGKLFRCEHCFAVDTIDGKSNVIGDLDHGLYYNDIDRLYKQETSCDACPTCPYYPACRGKCRTEKLINHCDINCDTVKSEIIATLKYRLAVLDKEKMCSKV